MLPARTLTIGLITLAGLASIAALKLPPQPTPRTYEIEADQVVSRQNGAKKGITGYWKLKPSPTGHLSRGKAGACVLQSLTDFTDQPLTPCSGPTFQAANMSCTVQIPAGMPQPGYSGYCNTDEQTCWVRPPSGPLENAAMTACNRSSDYDNDSRFWNPGRHEANVQPIDPRSPPGKTTHWRVLACLRGYDPVTQTDAPPGCPLRAWGQILASPPPA